MTKKKALITGVTGQDGSYLAEFLLAKGYDVYGMVRRTSTVHHERIRHIQDQITLVQGDLSDQTSLTRAMSDIMPDEVYNLAAQSFVPTSWNQPAFTGDITGIGVTRMLESVHTVKPDTRFYQASSSEMFGKVQAVPQKEDTPFWPRSPYGVAKVYGHWITVNYRESYDMYAVSGILFNHECVTKETPVFIKRADGLIDLLPIEDIVPHRTSAEHGTKYTTEPSEALYVWDKTGWSKVTCMTATWNGFVKKENKVVHRIASRGSVYQATSDHVVFACEDNQPVEKPAGTIQEGDRLALIDLPEPTEKITMTNDEAWLIGVILAEGSINENSKLHFTNQDETFLQAVTDCWMRVAGGTTSRYVHASGFENGGDVTQLRMIGNNAYVRYLAEEMYTRSGQKRIPKRILNASYEQRMAFLQGFHEGDGLKAANGSYHFKGFKTKFAIVAAGLYWLALTTLRQRAIICLEEREDRLYYQINLNTPDETSKGRHLRRPLDEVVKAKAIDYKDWLFDLATESGTFHAGIGQGWIHNSPRRGLEFVTRKVTYHTAKIKLGMTNELRMGNLDAQRDWGFAGDYVQAMWLMLQQDSPDDYVVATGKTHTVERLLDVAFSCVDLNWKDYVVQDEKFMRPAEVDLLIGDPAKAHAKMGWEPNVTFEEMIQMMVEADIQRLKKDPDNMA